MNQLSEALKSALCWRKEEVLVSYLLSSLCVGLDCIPREQLNSIVSYVYLFNLSLHFTKVINHLFKHAIKHLQLKCDDGLLMEMESSL